MLAYFLLKNITVESPYYCFHYLLKICSVIDAVELTTNHFQQDISIKLENGYLSTLLTGNVMKFYVD